MVTTDTVRCRSKESPVQVGMACRMSALCEILSGRRQRYLAAWKGGSIGGHALEAELCYSQQLGGQPHKQPGEGALAGLRLHVAAAVLETCNCVSEALQLQTTGTQQGVM